MKTITFSYNWNNKLGRKAFTTIRLYNPNKYKIGETYNINLKKECIGAGKIIAIKNFMLKDSMNSLPTSIRAILKKNVRR